MQCIKVLKKEKIVDIKAKDTLSDATAGGIEREMNITFELSQKYVDDWINVTEDEISNGIYQMLIGHNKLIEGSAGCGIGALFTTPEKFAGKNVVVIICGANLGINDLKIVIDKNYDVVVN